MILHLRNANQTVCVCVSLCASTVVGWPTASCAPAARQHLSEPFPRAIQWHLADGQSCGWPHLGPAATMMVWGSVGHQWARPAEKKTTHTWVCVIWKKRYVWMNTNYLIAGMGQTNWAMLTCKNPKTEYKEASQWPISSTGKSAKLDKRATFPKPFLNYSIALQQIHKMMSCKAQTMKHCKLSDQV